MWQSPKQLCERIDREVWRNMPHEKDTVPVQDDDVFYTLVDHILS